MSHPERIAPAALAMREPVSRIHVIGGPGTGKSTLARRLGQMYGLPVHELDQIAYEGIDFRPRDRAACLARAEEIAAQERWVTEGIFVDWTEPLLTRADSIVWLDYTAWSGSAVRIVLRTFRGALLEIGRRRGRERFLRFDDYRRNLRGLSTVLVDSREFWHPAAEAAHYPVTREAIRRVLEAHRPKVVHVTRRRDVRTLARPRPLAVARD